MTEGQGTQVVPESKHCMSFAMVLNYKIFFGGFKKTIIFVTENHE